MIPAGAQSQPTDRAIVGFRGGTSTLMAAIDLCRRHGGTVLLRQQDVMVIEFCAAPAALREQLKLLPRRSVTHFCRT